MTARIAEAKVRFQSDPGLETTLPSTASFWKSTEALEGQSLSTAARLAEISTLSQKTQLEVEEEMASLPGGVGRLAQIGDAFRALGFGDIMEDTGGVADDPVMEQGLAALEQANKALSDLAKPGFATERAKAFDGITSHPGFAAFKAAAGFSEGHDGDVDAVFEIVRQQRPIVARNLAAGKASARLSEEQKAQGSTALGKVFGGRVAQHERGVEDRKEVEAARSAVGAPEASSLSAPAPLISAEPATGEGEGEGEGAPEPGTDPEGPGTSRTPPSGSSNADSIGTKAYESVAGMPDGAALAIDAGLSPKAQARNAKLREIYSA